MLQRNEIEKKVSVIILCAGKGKRLKELTKHMPKPLLRTKALGNVPILHHTIHNIAKLRIKQINIVIGYLGSKINDSIQKFTEDHREFRNKIDLIDASIDYKKGPLYSFLSITKNNRVFKPDSIYVVIPGDTIFEFDLLYEMFSIIFKKYSLSQENQIVFYRNIETVNLIEFNRFIVEKTPHFVSFVGIERYNNEEFVKKIGKKRIEELVNFDKIMQVIPVFTFSYNFVKKIIECEKETSFQTLREIVNYTIQKGEKFLAVDIKPMHNFYDIDNISDIKYAEYDIIRKKKEGQ